MFIDHRFKFKEEYKKQILETPVEFKYGVFGEVVFYRTYSRYIEAEDRNESFNDVVLRVIEGVISIRKNHYIKNYLTWDEDYYQDYALEMAKYMLEFKFLPPGRGLWSMGTEYVYERGSTSLFNCAGRSLDTEDLANAVCWIFDALMLGVGVGFDTKWKGLGDTKEERKKHKPNKKEVKKYIIPDSREGWVESLRLLIRAYTHKEPFPEFSYSKIRKAGAPIKGFGGVSSGPKYLKDLHDSVELLFDNYINKRFDETRLIVDLMNYIGVCVIAGNVRRAASLAIGSIKDEVFLNLKNYEKNPEREAIGWMSNNSVGLWDKHDFNKIPNIIETIKTNGEPGLINFINIQKYGRMFEEVEDKANTLNPCGELPLEGNDGELCNLSEVFPINCNGKADFFKALEFSTFYCQTVTLLPTHSAATNKVIAKNRRIGVALGGLAMWLDNIGGTKMHRFLREAYKHVKDLSVSFSKKSGVQSPIKVTTVKPSGTISWLAGVSAGMHFPNSKYFIRRIRISKNSSISNFLIDKGVPNEPDVHDSNTLIFSFPLELKHKVRTVDEVSAWEQLQFLASLQLNWADNSVSCTVTFDPETESHQIENMISMYLPLVKSLTMLPKHTKSYPQMPEEKVTKEQFKELVEIPKLDWSKFKSIDKTDSDDKFCSDDKCQI